MKGILEKIVTRTRAGLPARMASAPQCELEKLAAAAPPPRPFAAALRRERLQVIAEVKRASPSKGPIRPGLDPSGLARSYLSGGAAAISVLTEGPHFGGSLADLLAVRRSVDLPVLRKDFIVSEYQLLEARAAGADAVLLIAAVLAIANLGYLLRRTRDLGMEALVETHDEAELAAALEAGAQIVGVNNRNLEDFTVDLATTERLRPLVPPEVVLVSESGVRGPADACRLWSCGVDALLVGESLVRAEDPAVAVRRLIEW